MGGRPPRPGAGLIDPGAFFWALLKASLFSSGGQGNLPSLHQDFLARGWAGDQQFAEALAIGQLAPGPNGLWVVALGYVTWGLAGAGLASIAVIVPALLALPLARVHRRFARTTAVRGFARGLTLAVAASVPVVVARVVGSYGLDLPAVAIVAGSCALLASRRAPPVAVLAAGALLGALVYR